MPDDQLPQFSAGWDIAARRQGTDGLTVTTYAKKKRRYDVVSTEGSFANIAYKRFDLTQICRILLHENPSFSGHKNALAAALCGWMLDPKEWVPRRRLVALSIGTTLARAERAANKRSATRTATEYYYPRTTRISPAFFDELYDPIGGLRTIVRTPTYYGIYYGFATERERLYDTIVIASIDHCHQRLAVDNSMLDNISIERPCEVYFLIEMAMTGSKGPNVANLKTHYLGKFEKSIPFSCAASTIKISESQTLLRAIAAGKWSAIPRPGVLPELFGKALYYAQTVYGKNKKAGNRVAIVDDIVSALRGV
ncbi:hypothetical protein [Methylorubrum extorquens]|uniref:hypothetical protein n=1 Tax=Methylorubrum extorquens TaxID=408 RepID=UPI0020A0C994|nr:hypothetical protein [Methylorubrum extorquens]MCP1538109.1 hypothetical protein [Methylorubrum extorquens]